MSTNTDLRFPTDAELTAEIAAPAKEECSSALSLIVNTVCAPDDESD